jgi:hypothetical protein
MIRPAATLMEVLIAIFLMGIGLVTLLTLFPLGALTMSQALQDSMAAHAAANARALANARGFHHDPFVDGRSDGVDLFADPGNGLPPADPDGPSYPVFVDPFGYYLGWGTVGNLPAGIPRRSVGHLETIDDPWLKYQMALQSFVLQDDMKFHNSRGKAGLPCPPGGLVQRYGQFSWAYLLRRPKTADTSVVDMTVVVYSGRSLQLPLGEAAYPRVSFDPNTTLVQVDYTGREKPDIRKGNWIMDATLTTTAAGSAHRSLLLRRDGGQADLPDPHGFFYRVVGVSDVGPNVVALELQTKPYKATGGDGVLIVLDNVIEVFDKGSGWQP